MSSLFYLPKQQGFDGSGNVLPGARLYFYQSGTTTAKNTYADRDRNVPHTNPVVADGQGVFPAIFLEPGEYRVRLTTAADVQRWQVDEVDGDEFSAEAIGALLYPRTTAEIVAGVTPTYFQYPPGDVRRYGAVGDGVTDDTAALKSAHAANRFGEVIYRAATYLVSDSIPFYSQSRYRGVLGKTVIYCAANKPICVSADYLSALSGATVTGYLDVRGIEARGNGHTEATGTAQAGGSTSITLAASASASNDAYNNMFVQITGGTGAGQARIVSAYNGSTKVATVGGAWTTTPDNTSTYRISYQVGWIIRDYYVSLDELIARDCGGGGFVITHLDDSGSAVGGTLVEGKIGKLAARNCGGNLFHFGSNGNAKITDWEVEHLLAQATTTTAQALYIGQSAGWRITRIHTYGTALPEPVEIIAPFKTAILDAYIESYTTTAIRVGSLQEGLFLRAQIDAGSAAASSNAVRISRSGPYSNTPCQVHLNIDMASNANSCNGLNLVNSSMVAFGVVLVGGTNASNMTPVVTSSGSTTHVVTNNGFTTFGGLVLRAGAGTPEEVVTAPVGSLFMRSDGGANTSIYVKESGTGNTGWVAK